MKTLEDPSGNRTRNQLRKRLMVTTVNAHVIVILFTHSQNCIHDLTSWLTHRTTSRKVAGSIPHGDNGIFH